MATGAPVFPRRDSAGTDNPAHVQAAAIINGQFALPAETIQAMNEIRVILADTAQMLIQATRPLAFRDEGQLLSVIYDLQALKDKACAALIRPYAPGTVAALKLAEANAMPQ